MLSQTVNGLIYYDELDSYANGWLLSTGYGGSGGGVSTTTKKTGVASLYTAISDPSTGGMAVWCETHKCWVAARTLKEDCALLKRSGEVVRVSRNRFGGFARKVKNHETRDHIYYANGFLVHNMKFLPNPLRSRLLRKRLRK